MCDVFCLPSFTADCKLTSRERAKLCFKAARCTPHQGNSFGRKKSYMISLTVLIKHQFDYLCCCFLANLGDVEKYTFADLNLGNERVNSC